MRLRNDIRVEYVDHVGSDSAVARAAWVLDPVGPRRPRSIWSGVAAVCRVIFGVAHPLPPAPLHDDTPDGHRKVIGAMMRGRHGTPFEHGSLTVYVEAPLFVFREWHRHRIAWSYNEVSGRYRVLPCEFWVPPPDRSTVEPAGFKPLRPVLRRGSRLTRLLTLSAAWIAYGACSAVYWLLIRLGVAREVARAVLPVGTYSAMYATCNPRSLMVFLSLRTHDPDAAYPSYPQEEIEDAARQLETLFARHWPLCHAAFVANRRVAP